MNYNIIIVLQEAECDQEAGQRPNSSGNQTESTENRKPIHDKDETPLAFQPVKNAMSLQSKQLS